LAFLALGKKGDFARLFFPKSRKPVSKGIKSIFRKLGKYGFLSLAPFGDGFVVKQVQILKTASENSERVLYYFIRCKQM
jgi:hypothetical protein